MGLVVAILFCLLAVTCLGQSTNKHMICKSVDDVFDDAGSTGVSRRRNIGPPGKPGLPGIVGGRGLPGPKGSDGEVDYERLERIVRDRVNEEIRGIETKLNEVNRQLNNMTEKLNRINSQSAMCDGLKYNGWCFSAEVQNSGHVNYAKAQEICRNRGSRLADIDGYYHYIYTMGYLRTKLYFGTIRVWTGMKKKYQDPNAYLSDNTRASYTKARSSGPTWNSASRAHTQVYLYVRESSYTGSDQGMSVGETSLSKQGALCQSKL